MNNNTKITYTPKGPDIEGTSGPFLTSRLMWRELASARELIGLLVCSVKNEEMSIIKRPLKKSSTVLITQTHYILSRFNRCNLVFICEIRDCWVFQQALKSDPVTS